MAIIGCVGLAWLAMCLLADRSWLGGQSGDGRGSGCFAWSRVGCGHYKGALMIIITPQ
ncbi:hypothetical protein CY34DRAFT_809850 [Suillus luteus UH-Slu-Lm8-n1]|uniref:Uncharacterized protein n=1 Tax=Suillus luteus UH-Slu-Lm8-n1 TaxID=930992 RepID=A0A0D0AUG4_9AGAM|nr:hypothetical protein CY34DRAFT_809850 [Suillus luteus UH-Slu-Lm8-n1]